MAEASVYTFSFRELAELLVKKQGIHEGHWGIRVKFGINAANMGGLGDTPLLPTALVPVIEIGIQKFDRPNDLAVDASQVNPPKPKRQRKQLVQ